MCRMRLGEMTCKMARKIAMRIGRETTWKDVKDGEEAWSEDMDWKIVLKIKLIDLNGVLF